MGSLDEMPGLLPYVQAPRSFHTHTIILLHGRGSTAPEFAKQLFESQASPNEGDLRTLPDLFPTVRWVFPQSGTSKAFRFGSAQPQWFDIWSTDDPEDQYHVQVPGLRQSINNVAHTIIHEARLVGMANIFLGGFSQGFTTALTAFLATSKNHYLDLLAGLIGISAWMPSTSVLDALSNQDPLSPHRERKQVPVFTPILLQHAKDDSTVGIKQGRQMRDRLNAFACNVTLHEYEKGEHWVNEPQGIDDIVAFVRKRMQRLDVEQQHSLLTPLNKNDQGIVAGKETAQGITVEKKPAYPLVTCDEIAA